MVGRQRIVSLDNDETEPLYGSAAMQEREVRPWNIFRDPPRKKDSGSTADTTYFDFSVKLLKLITVFGSFVIVLGSAVISKASLLLMTSQIQKNVTRPYCNKELDPEGQYVVTLPEIERRTWIWMVIFAYFVPELGTLLRSLRICLFKSWQRPNVWDFVGLLATESCPAIGSALLAFVILPELDVIKAAMLTNAVCFVPGVVTFLSRRRPQRNYLKVSLDIVCMLGQASSFVVWPLLEDKPILYWIPVSVILISIGWWENFVSTQSPIGFIQRIGRIKQEFDNKTYFVYIFMSIVKCILFFSTVLIIYWIKEDDPSYLFNGLPNIFKNHTIYVSEIEPTISLNIRDAIKRGYDIPIRTDPLTPLCIFGINILSSYICYIFGKFACKVMVQGFGFAFPINLAVPVLLSVLIAMCGTFNKDECSFTATIPEYLFFATPPLYYLNDFISHQHSYVWLVWLLSQAWITVHVWSPSFEKLARTEKLFVRPMYDAFLIDQDLALNRRRCEEDDHDERGGSTSDSDLFDANDGEVTRIYACATMWHETREEMMEFLKSIFRMDEDQCANRIVRNYMQYKLPSYYEFETHIFFDDAFLRVNNMDNDPLLNSYVKELISAMDEAASDVHGTTVCIRPPKIFPTPYGGRLVWTLPGKTRMVAHLKDKKKIRNKKRWSQVMYMYYLLGYRLMNNDDISVDKKDKVAENTYLLALDGDIDFQPQAVHLLVDYMKKNKSLGAACGRIHPIGSGAIAWYQMFEYAVGHWMQKATEHVFGCVLCSPGCFSLFRAKALMDNSVMRKYTTRSIEAKHYVQYDQGEDRWLCTLLLQMGYRVEYSAASDAYTHCPEGFNEFYNQRRRWMPSTMANILDLLMDYKHTVAVNDNISKLYIFYQIVLLIGTVLGPGTIFLMLLGAFVTAFGMDQWSSFYWNITPILIYVIVCATCNEKVQLFVAGIISAMYGLVMMAVIVGVMLQISEDGAMAPSSLFFFCIVGEMVIAAILHPKEFNCLKYGIIYYVTVPSMYMLLVIYSVFNMNNVSWGTREVTVMPQQAQQKDDTTNKKVEEKGNRILSFFGANTADNEGSIEFSLNKMFKCMLCTYRNDVEENFQLRQIQTSIDALTRKIEQLEHRQYAEATEPRTTTINKRSTIVGFDGQRNQNQVVTTTIEEDQDEQDLISFHSDDLVENSWFYDGNMARSEVHFLDNKEEVFWNELLDLYLHPIEDDKAKMQKELKDLRDKMVFTFFMVNSLFVLVVFLLTLKKDTLHFNWPVNPKVNFTYIYDKNEIHITRTYLQLEPIGFVFLIFFFLLLGIQFIGMLLHRFGTYCQIISNTNVDFNLFNKNVENLTREEVFARDPLKIARDLQQLKGINRENEEEPLVPANRRRTVHALAIEKDHSSGVIFDLDKAFHSRLKNISNGRDAGMNDNRRKSVAWVNNRRQTLRTRPSSTSGGFTNRGYIFNDGEEASCDV